METIEHLNVYERKKCVFSFCNQCLRFKWLHKYILALIVAVFSL